MKRLFGLFSKENSVRSASIILIVTLALSNILGLLRDRFLAKNILTSDLDVYYASFRIPDLIFNFLILGAITSAFIPIFSEYIVGKKLKEGYRITNSLINLALVTLIVLAVIFCLLMPQLMPLVVPKFDQERMSQAVRYSRMLMLTPIFFSISYIMGGILNSFKRFLAYSLAPIVYNLAIIIGAAFYASKYGVSAVVYCVIIGSFLHFLVQLPPVLKLGFRFGAVFDWKDKTLKRILRLMVPRTIGMGANQLMLVVYTAVASSLAAGSIAAFTLSNNIQTMPSVVFGTSFATAVFPTLTGKIAKHDKEGFAFYLNRTIRSIAFLLIPSSIIFILLRAQIVRLILGSGKFTWDDTKRTALTLGLFSISLLAQGLIPLLARAFYALKNTKTPMYISIVTTIISIVLGFPLAKMFGVAGLALAFSISSFINVGILFFYLRQIYPEIWNRGVSYSYLRIIGMSLIMGLSVWASMHIAANFVNMDRFWGIFAQTCFALIVGLVSYFALSRIFDCEEMKWALTRKINGRKTELSTAENIEEAEYEKV